MTTRKLKRVCAEFRSGLLNNRPSQGMCAVVSYPLAGFLSVMGVDCEIKTGDVGCWNHVWLVMADGNVIDATADQFGYEAVYIGPPLQIHMEPSRAE